MANVIYSDGNTAMAALFGRQSDGLMNMLQTNVQNFAQAVAPAAVGIADRVMGRLQEYTTGSIARQVDAIRNTLNHAWQTDCIRQLETIDDIQYAPSAMRRYVMAEPQTRAMYNAGRVEGYEDKYVDANAGAIGTRHYDYRVATSGVVLSETNSDDKPVYRVRQFFERQKEDFTPTIREKASIQHTWELQRQLLSEEMLDFTSEENALLG